MSGNLANATITARRSAKDAVDDGFALFAVRSGSAKDKFVRAARRSLGTNLSSSPTKLEDTDSATARGKLRSSPTNTRTAKISSFVLKCASGFRHVEVAYSIQPPPSTKSAS